ncbi:spore germination protein GerPE [Bacillus sp. ISL-7]|uniref:spore germination protein GerPE n=1 Tax=Bacillus sp. ISL-7 TaxID=2819136 RepID=UPI001BE7740C|nr:spore germination protein GerPE [Bacillus sp. ISL-7]MBT2738789.1 spore germination protein GerPE [Bacillus sp. ISL-7]
MLKRSSYVDSINLKLAVYSSIVQLGDSCIINSLSRALAVQREAEIFFGNEGSFAAYPKFSEPIPFVPITEDISVRYHHLNPVIKVKNINILAISSATVLHVGNSQNISMEARVKNIRQLLPMEEERL